jgi:alpha-ribazole phosphatase
MDLVLIRHPAVAVEPGVCYGNSDVPLAADPATSALALTSRLAALDAPLPRVLFTSPLSRCAHVAQALAAEARCDVCTDARLAEMHFGAWELQRWDAIDRGALDAWAANFEHAREHGGESVAQFVARVNAWLDVSVDAGAQVDSVNVTREHTTPPTAARTALWAVTHAGVIRAIASRVLGLPLAHCMKWPLALPAVVWLRRDAVDSPWALVRWNV